MMEYYSVKDIAELLNISKTTVQRYIDKADIKADKQETQRNLYQEKTAAVIVRMIKPDYLFTADYWSASILQEPPQDTTTPLHETETPPRQTTTPLQETAADTTTPLQETTIPPQETAAPLQLTELELLKKAMDMLQQELDQKNKDIAFYKELIKDYSLKLEEAQRATRREQELSAADKMKSLQEAAERPQQPQKDYEEVQQEPEPGNTAGAAAAEPTSQEEHKEPIKEEASKGIFSRIISFLRG